MTLNYGNYGIFHMMGYAGFIPSTVVCVSFRMVLSISASVCLWNRVSVLTGHNRKFHKLKLRVWRFRVHGLGFRALGVEGLRFRV